VCVLCAIRSLATPTRSLCHCVPAHRACMCVCVRMHVRDRERGRVCACCVCKHVHEVFVVALQVYCGCILDATRLICKQPGGCVNGAWRCLCVCVRGRVWMIPHSYYVYFTHTHAHAHTHAKQTMLHENERYIRMNICVTIFTWRDRERDLHVMVFL